ncbi:MAG: tRNA pseudouridine synthase B [Fimbriimonadaceae bacterium]|nr:tRNA pseudouridine synthase B [Fimbriimonadaceae bacterium]
MLGIVLIDKPAGITSHDVVNRVRRQYGTRRVGHSGTLDPSATGLLVVAIGPATRFLQYLPMEPKEYTGRIRFGIETTTQDAEGDTVQERPLPGDLTDRITETLPSFIGEIQQTPPMYSAIKRDGKPLYAYARAGQEVERQDRTVYIKEFKSGGIEADQMEFLVVCSGGTYVRTLAHDLGQAVGCGAHLASLRRTRVGRFSVDQAVALDALDHGTILPLSQALPPMPILSLGFQQVAAIREGRAIPFAEPPSARLAALADENGEVFSVAEVQGAVLQPQCVIPVGAMGAQV